MTPYTFRATVVFGVLTLLLAPTSGLAQQIGTCTRSQGEAYLDINDVRARIVNTGGLLYRGVPHIYEVPAGSGKHAIFAGALWIGGMIDGELRLSAARYGNNELWAGPLDDSGNPPEDCNVYDRIYNVSSSDISSYGTTGVASADMRDWPTGLGAPTVDADGNEIDLMDLPLSVRRDRIIDLSSGERPLVFGNQSVWWVMNDRGNVHNSKGSTPILWTVELRTFCPVWSLHLTTLRRIMEKFDVIKNVSPCLDTCYKAATVDSFLAKFEIIVKRVSECSTDVIRCSHPSRCEQIDSRCCNAV